MNKFKVGDIIQQQFCKIKLRVKFLGEDYLLGETLYGNHPSILQSENYDLWKTMPEVFNVDELVLKRAWLGCGDNFSTFVKLINKYQQDFKESSLP